MPATCKDPIASLSHFVPGLREGSGPAGPIMGKQLIVSKQIGPALVADSTTYSVPLFVAPVKGAYLKRVYLVAHVANDDGASTVDVYRYDGSSDVQQLASQYDPSNMSDKTPAKLSLTTTRGDRQADAGDYWWIEWAQGTVTATVEGVVAVAVFIVPEVSAD